MSSVLDKNASTMTIVLDKIVKFKYFCKISQYFLSMHNLAKPEPKRKICHQDTKAPRYTKGFYYKNWFSLFLMVRGGATSQSRILGVSGPRGLGGNVLPENGKTLQLGNLFSPETNGN